jgi:ankyrin repeat protein
LEEVERLLGEGADINWIGEGDKTPLSIAAYCNHPKVVQLLLKHGANINTTDKNNRAPVTWAAAFKDHYSVVEILINNGADLEIPSLNTGSTTLFVASHAGNFDIIKLLVSKGAKWNVKNRKGMFPIDIARQEGHTEVVEYLSSLDSMRSWMNIMMLNFSIMVDCFL